MSFAHLLLVPGWVHTVTLGPTEQPGARAGARSASVDVYGPSSAGHVAICERTMHARNLLQLYDYFFKQHTAKLRKLTAQRIPISHRKN